MAAVKIFQYEVKDAQNESDRKISQIAESQQRTENKIEGMIQAQKESDRKISELAESQKEFTQVLKELIQAQKELTDAQKQTDKKLGELADAQKRTENRMEELADAQKRTENRMEELADAQKELTEAQKRTEKRVEELADAQKRTEIEVSKLSSGLNGVRHQIGGLSKSVAYSLENEAYRKLPAYLKNRFQISMEERLIRTTVSAKEINIFAKARQNGNEVIIVGECVLKLDDRSKLGQLEESVEIVKQHYRQPVVPLVITHFAQSDIFSKASEEGIIVVQSFEWD